MQSCAFVFLVILQLILTVCISVKLYNAAAHVVAACNSELSLADMLILESAALVFSSAIAVFCLVPKVALPKNCMPVNFSSLYDLLPKVWLPMSVYPFLSHILAK
jgi:hypothetical protein